MPQPAFRVRPASWTLSRMLSIESRIVAETVQLMVDVAGLCASAPAFDVMRPAGIAPRRSAQKKRWYQCSRNSGVASTSDKARATRCQVSSTVWSTGTPDLSLSRYFLSQMSYEAGCNGISIAAPRPGSGVTSGWVIGTRTVLIGLADLRVLCWPRCGDWIMTTWWAAVVADRASPPRVRHGKDHQILLEKTAAGTRYCVQRQGS